MGNIFEYGTNAVGCNRQLQTQRGSVTLREQDKPLTNMYELQQSLAAINAIKSDTAKLVLSNAEILSTMKSVLNGTGTKELKRFP